jgi:hypothetical protein
MICRFSGVIKYYREKFMAECRSITREIDKKNSLPLSEDRILKIAREILKKINATV